MTVRVWNAVTGEIEKFLHGHSDIVTTVSFIYGGSKIVSGSGDNTVRVWDAITGKQEIWGDFNTHVSKISVVGNTCAVATSNGIFLTELYLMQPYDDGPRTKGGKKSNRKSRKYRKGKKGKKGKKSKKSKK